MFETTPEETAMETRDLADYFGSYGGRYVGETLRPALDRLEAEFAAAWSDRACQASLDAGFGVRTRGQMLALAGRAHAVAVGSHFLEVSRRAGAPARRRRRRPFVRRRRP